MLLSEIVKTSMLYLMGEIMEINEMGLELMEGLPIVWMPRFIRKRVNSKIFSQLLHRKKLRFKVAFAKLFNLLTSIAKWPQMNE